MTNEPNNNSKVDWHRRFLNSTKVILRILTVPLVIAAVKGAFCLGPYVYKEAVEFSSRFSVVPALLSTLALFGGVSYVTRLGWQGLRNQANRLCKGFCRYFKAVCNPDREFSKSIREIALPTALILLLIFSAGVVSSFMSTNLANMNVPRTVSVSTDAGDMTVVVERHGEETTGVDIRGTKDTIELVVKQTLEDLGGSDGVFRLQRLDDPNNWRVANYVASFPIFFDRGSVEPITNSPSAGEPEANDFEFREGVEYNGELVENLVKALAPCGSTIWPVVLSVQGYASSSKFKDEEGFIRSQSKSLNVRIANERRRNVEQALREAIEKVHTKGIHLIIGKDYKDFSQLLGDRRFNDRPGGNEGNQQSLPQDFLTRVAYINVLSAAGCGIG